MVKISDFPEGATPAANDLVPYVDVSDTTDGPTGTTKHALMENFFAYPVLLDDGVGVDGALPLAHVAFPFVESFHMGGVVEVAVGEALWVCEYPYVDILGIRASVGRNGSPTTTDVIVDVVAGTYDPTPTYASVFPTSAKPTVEVGQIVGDRVVPDTLTLTRGQTLSVDVEQTDAAAADLTVNIYMIAYGYPETSYVPEVTPAPDTVY